METNSLTVVSCSGASNTGKYSDVVARQLMQSGKAKMLCLANLNVTGGKRGENALAILMGIQIQKPEK